MAQRWADIIGPADGFIVITPEYNHGYPAVLKSALDAVYREWVRKPIAFVSYGGWAAGTRSVEQLRTVAIELQMAPIRPSVALQLAPRLFDAEGNLKDPDLHQHDHDRDARRPRLVGERASRSASCDRRPKLRRSRASTAGRRR